MAAGSVPSTAREQRRVDRPEVDGVLQVARVEVREAGLVAEEAVLDVLADQEDRRRGAVVGAPGRVGRHATPELAVDGDHDPARVRVALEAVGQRRDALVELGEQPGMVVELGDVGVEASEAGRVHPRRESRLDEAGDRVHLGGQPGAGRALLRRGRGGCRLERPVGGGRGRRHRAEGLVQPGRHREQVGAGLVDPAHEVVARRRGELLVRSQVRAGERHVARARQEGGTGGAGALEQERQRRCGRQREERVVVVGAVEPTTEPPGWCRAGRAGPSARCPSSGSG